MIKITRWNGDDLEEPYFAVSLKQDARMYGYRVWVLTGPEGVVTDSRHGNEWYLQRKDDDWGYVPDRKVPDHVWAALAAWKLTGNGELPE